MIKKSGKKFFICLFVFVTIFSVTSSCFAFSTDNYLNSDEYYFEILKNDAISHGFNKNNHKFIFYKYSASYGNYYKFTYSFKFFSNDVDYLKVVQQSSTNYLVYFYDSSDHLLSSEYLTRSMAFDSTSVNSSLTPLTMNYFNLYDNKNDLKILDNSTVNIKDSSGNLIYTAVADKLVNASYEFNLDSSANVTFDLSNAPANIILKYSIAGLLPSMENLGQFDLINPIIYRPGITNLKVKDNTKVYYTLYDTNDNQLESGVLEVPAYDVISENSEKDITYNLTYSNDYKSASLTASISNGVFSDKLMYSTVNVLNGLTGKLYGAKQFPNSLNLSENGVIYLYAVDALENVFKVKAISVTNIFNFVDSDFSYEFYNESTLHGGYLLRYFPKIRKWSNNAEIKVDLNLTSGNEMAYVTATDCVENKGISNPFGNNDSWSFSVNSGSEIVIKSPANKLENLCGTISFSIINKRDNSVVKVFTYSININSYTVHNTTSGSSGSDVGDSSPNSSNNNGYGSDYPDVTWNDIKNQINTSGDFWQVIKLIFSCIPKWLVSPIFFFVSAVVTIVLTKLIVNAVTAIMG